jgi:hypothetical protein
VAYDDEGTGTETLADRYQINGLIDTANPVLENAEAVVNAAASWLSYDVHLGQWGVVINKAESSVASFNDSNILGSITVNGTGLQDLYNQVKVEFPHRELKDSADFYNIQVPDTSIPSDWADFSRNANEEDNVLNITYDIINEPVQAQLLGLIELKQSRLDKVIRFETDFTYYNLKAGDVVSVTNSRFGFTNKLFRIINISENQNNGEALSMAITALEYNVNVYSIADLFRFTRSDEDGIISLGSIGTPGTPTVTKIEQDSRPRIEITSTAPTGIVEGLEYWLTSDVTIPDDNNRSYTLIGIRRPVGGGVFTSGTSVMLEYVPAAGNFLVKTRGFNTNTVGSFSTPSGLIEFAPTQVTDAIGPDTSAIDALGGLLTALAIVDLLKLVDELYQGVSGNGSLFERIFQTLEDVTGIDFTQPDAIETQLPILDEGTQKTAAVSSINFIGAGVTVTNVGNAITVNIPGGGGGGTPEEEDPFYYFPKPTPPVTSAGDGVPTAALRLVSTLPTDKSAWAEQNVLLGPPLVPNTGPYFTRWAFKETANGGNTGMVTALIKGTGSANLYKSDGTLVESVPASATTVTNDVVSITFDDREPGTDYYVLFDADFVRYCSVESLEMDNPQTWNFTTSPFELAELTAPTPTALASVSAVTVEEITAFDDPCNPGGDLEVRYSQKIIKGTGSIRIREYEPVSNAFVQELYYNVTDAVIRDYKSDTVKTDGEYQVLGDDTILAWVGLGSNFQPGSKYEVFVPAGIARANVEPTAICEVQVTARDAESGTSEFVIPNTPKFDLLHYHLYSTPYTGYNNVNIRSRVKLEFNKNFKLSTTDKYIDIYEDGSLWQRFNVRSQYKDAGESEIIMYASDPISDPYIGQVDPNSTGVNYPEDVIWNFEGGAKNSPFTKADFKVQPTVGGYNSTQQSGDPDVTGANIPTTATTKITKIPNKTNPGTGSWEYDSSTSKWIWVVKETVTTEEISAHDCSNGTQSISKTVESKYWKGEYNCETSSWDWAIYKPTEAADPVPATPNWNSSKQTEPSINVILLNPTKIMKQGSSYYILIEEGALLATDCEVSESFGGISDTSRIAWTTDNLVNVVRSPVDTQGGVLPVNSQNTRFEIDRPAVPGPGRLVVYDEDDVVIATFNSDDPRINYA